MSDICFSIFISFSPKKKETGTEHSLYKDTKTFKRNPVIFSPHHPNIYTWKKLKGKRLIKLGRLLFSPLLIFLNPTVLMLTLYYFFFSTFNKSCSGCIFSYLFTFLGFQNLGAGRNKSPSNNQFSGEDIYFCHFGQKVHYEMWVPQIPVGYISSFDLTSFCICLFKGATCVTCQ